jgi:hypothetical protein
MRTKGLTAVVLAVALAGCAGMTDTEQRLVTGTAGGTAAGAAIGAIAGNAALGAGIGAGVGLAGSYLWDRHRQAEQRAFEEGVATGRAGG